MMSRYILGVAKPAFLILAMMGGASPAVAQGNECTTVVLHAITGATGMGPCVSSVNCTIVSPIVRVNNPTGAYTARM